MRSAFALLSTALLLCALSPVATASSFDIETASFLSALNAIAYCPPTDIEQWACPACSSNFTLKYFVKSNTTMTTAYIIDNSDDLSIVVFKGTDPLSWTQWVDDATTAKMKVPEFCTDCEVHSGFYKEYNAIRDDLFKAMTTSYNSLPSPNRRIVITGHSLGAAVCALYAVHVTQNGLTPLVYAFGGPRLGNQAWVDAYAAAIPVHFRVVHSKDIVPHLPPNICGYVHHGTLVYCDDAAGVSCNVMPGAEDDGGFLHISVSDHGQYCGVNFFNYLDIGSQSGCKALPSTNSGALFPTRLVFPTTSVISN